MEGEQELVYDLSNDTISNDLERTITLFSTPFFNAKYLTNGFTYGHSYKKANRKPHPKLSNSTSFNDLESNRAILNYLE